MRKIIFLFGTLFVFLLFINGQNKINYAYDAAGNRINKVIVMSTKSTMAENPASFTEQLPERTIKIYPNPTKGYMKVEISEFDKVKSSSLTLLNMQGQTIVKMKMLSGSQDLDISSKPDGVYILHINIDGEISTWKIIKN